MVLIMFIMSFLLEISGAVYTIALSKNNLRAAVGVGAISSVLQWVVFAGVIYDLTVPIVLSAIAGEIMGTFVGMKISGVSRWGLRR